jgi:hypothetical protein
MEKIGHEIGLKGEEVYVPFAKVHEHLFGEMRSDRESLRPFMSAEMPICEYLDSIQSCKWVVSPAGDRPDTYRHWEVVALGSIVVSKLPPNFSELFGNSLLNLVDLSQFMNGIDGSVSCEPNPNLATMNYWANEIKLAKNVKSLN